MKRHTTLMVDDDLMRDVKDKGFNVSDLLKDAMLKATRPTPKTQKKEIKELRCSWCEKVILDELYYFCAIHENLFCEECAVNGRKRIWEVKEEGQRAPKCQNNYERVDCILEKREFTDGDSNQA